MTEKTYKPAPGARVRKPDGAPIADAGETLPDTPYFARLIADGDLVEADLAAPAKKKD